MTRIGVKFLYALALVAALSLQYSASSFEDAFLSESDPESGLRIEPYMYEPEEYEETSHSIVDSGGTNG